MGVGSQRHAKRAGETEIGQLQVALLVNEQVLGLQVAVQNAVGVAVLDALTELEHELSDDIVTQTEVLEVRRRALGEGLATATVTHGQGFHVLLEIEVEELENEVELVAVGVDDVEQADNVDILHLLEEGDLADSGAGNALIFGLETNLLERDDAAAVGQVSGFVDYAIGTFTNCRRQHELEGISGEGAGGEEMGQKTSSRVARLRGARQGYTWELTFTDLLQLLVVLHGVVQGRRLDGKTKI